MTDDPHARLWNPWGPKTDQPIPGDPWESDIDWNGPDYLPGTTNRTWTYT